MAYPQQYTPEQRKRAHELFWAGRKNRPGARGRYTGREIAQMTGISLTMVYRIANGER